MAEPGETAAVIALLRLARRQPAENAELVEKKQSALTALREELAQDGAQVTLLGDDPTPSLRQAQADLERWISSGIGVITVLDRRYPENLRQVHDRPPLLFVAGALQPGDQRSIAVIGARRASSAGVTAARRIAGDLAAGGFTVVSGLASGIDTAAHTSALAAGGRTVAVIGTGLSHSYPPENAPLQRQISERSAVVSQFWPDTPPSRETFPQRNAVMSGLTLGTVIVEAAERSGARIQARRALAHGRPVFLLPRVLGQAWAVELAAGPGVHVVDEAAQVIAVAERLTTTDVLTE
jgi:DNA processing protein